MGVWEGSKVAEVKKQSRAVLFGSLLILSVRI